MATHHLTTEQLSAYLDGEIQPNELPQIMSHLANCTECSRELDGLTLVKNAIAGLGEVDVPRSFTIGERMITSPAPQLTPVRAVPAGSARLHVMEQIVRIVAIAAAVVFLALGGAQIAGVFGEEDDPSTDVALVDETNSSGDASQDQESTSAPARGELRAAGESAAAESSALESELARVDTGAQADDSGLTPLQITTVGIGAVALAAGACWILLHKRTGTAS